MSMQPYATTGRGLVIPAPLLEYVVKRHEKYTEDCDVDFFFDEVNTIGGKTVASFAECIGDFFNLDENDYVEFSSDEVFKNSFYIIELDHYPSLFEQAYRDIDEVVEEYKTAVGKYFPANFNFKRYLVSYIGIYWG